MYSLAEVGSEPICSMLPYSRQTPLETGVLQPVGVLLILGNLGHSFIELTERKQAKFDICSARCHANCRHATDSPLRHHVARTLGHGSPPVRGRTTAAHSQGACHLHRLGDIEVTSGLYYSDNEMMLRRVSS